MHASLRTVWSQIACQLSVMLFRKSSQNARFIGMADELVSFVDKDGVEAQSRNFTEIL
jgi:hypothetical protein